MRIVILGAGADPDADAPYRMRAIVRDDDGTRRVDLRHGIWTCTTCRGGNCEHIAAVMPLAGQEQAAPVATEPVTLDVEDAIAVLDHHGIEGGYGGWTVVSVEEVGRGRWRSTHQIIIRNEAGEHFAAPVEQGLTEAQRTEPWAGEEAVTFHPVVPRSKVVHVVEWVAPEQSAQ